MIITIARKCGCDADSIGRAVAEKYHLHFMNREASSVLLAIVCTMMVREHR